MLIMSYPLSCPLSPLAFFPHSKCPCMLEQLCRKITDFPVLMTDLLPNQNPRHGLLDLQPVFTYFFLDKVQCKYKRTLDKVN